MSEHLTQQQILLALGSQPGVRLFRQNTGTGWVGQLLRRDSNTITLANPRPLHAGLHKGSADLIGWRSLVITPEMVGRRVAVMCSLEVKSATGRPTADQVVWLENLLHAGAYAGIVRSVEEARDVVFRP